MGEKIERFKVTVQGYEAARRGVKWWENPHTSGSSEAYAWDKGHTLHRLDYPAPAETPWCDCKIAFGVDDESKLWRAYDVGKLPLPEGWELIETDCSGARCVAIFRVEGVPQIAAGELVAGMMARFK